MGFFSEQSILEEAEFEGRGYPSHESQLLWRLEDLDNRYAELVSLDAPCYGDDYYTNDDYRYAPVECFETLADVARGIEIVKADLKCEYGADIDEQNGASIDENIDKVEIEQLELFNVYNFYIVAMPQVAA